MNLQQIIEALHTKGGIRSLNPMQEAMAETDARNIVLLAPTGSGKTIAFSIYMLRRVTRGVTRTSPAAVVLAPSRELVVQIAGVVRPIACGLRVATLYGGHSMTDEVNTLSVTPDIVIATPGRLLDHLQRRQINIDGVTTLVLDEYDKALELGFADEMTKIVRRMHSLCNTVLTSATRLAEFPPFLNLSEIETLDYTSITAAPRSRMRIARVESPVRDKLDTLVALLKSLPNERVIVFVNHRESAERVHNALVKAGFPAGLYHGGLEQRERQLAVDLLDNGTTPVLVSTDLASRGLDIDAVGSVIHYHLPPSTESWTHRNGRTARQDASGSVYAITCDGEDIPPYVNFDYDYFPTGRSEDPIRSDVATLYFNAGRREKISRGDIAGYLIKTGGLEPGEVGRISVADHYAIAAVPRGKVSEVVRTLAGTKLKGTRVKVTPLKP